MPRPTPRVLKFFHLSTYRPSLLKASACNDIVVCGLLPNFTVVSSQLTQKVSSLILLPLNPKRTNLNANSASSTTVVQSPNSYQKPTFWSRPLREKTTWFFWKFKYSGKGLKVKKANKQQQVLFNLGSSHISKLLFNTSTARVMRTKKNTYTLLSYKPHQPLTHQLMRRIRPFNKYTKRGLRLSRQPIARRFGKVSQLGAKKR